MRGLNCAGGLHQKPTAAHGGWLLGLGIVATLAANIAHGLGHGTIGAAVAAWPAVALVGSYELLMIIRGAQTPTATPRLHDGESVIDPLREQAAGCSRLNSQLIAFPQYVPSVLRYMLVSRAHSGCASTLPPPPIRTAKDWPH